MLHCAVIFRLRGFRLEADDLQDGFGPIKSEIYIGWCLLLLSLIYLSFCSLKPNYMPTSYQRQKNVSGLGHSPKKKTLRRDPCSPLANALFHWEHHHDTWSALSLDELTLWSWVYDEFIKQRLRTYHDLGTFQGIRDKTTEKTRWSVIRDIQTSRRDRSIGQSLH